MEKYRNAFLNFICFIFVKITLVYLKRVDKDFITIYLTIIAEKYFLSEKPEDTNK